MSCNQLLQADGTLSDAAVPTVTKALEVYWLYDFCTSVHVKIWLHADGFLQSNVIAWR